MVRPVICCVAALAFCGCKTQSPPGQDPFFGRTTVAPPATGASLGPQGYAAPGYAMPAAPGYPATMPGAATGTPGYPAISPGTSGYAAGGVPAAGGLRWMPPAGTVPPTYSNTAPPYGPAAPAQPNPYAPRFSPQPSGFGPAAQPVSQPSGIPTGSLPSGNSLGAAPGALNYRGAPTQPAYGTNFNPPDARLSGGLGPSSDRTAAAAPPASVVKIVEPPSRPRTLGSFAGASTDPPLSALAANGGGMGDPRQPIVRTLSPRPADTPRPVGYGLPNPAWPPLSGPTAASAPPTSASLRSVDIKDLPDAASAQLE